MLQLDEDDILKYSQNTSPHKLYGLKDLRILSISVSMIAVNTELRPFLQAGKVPGSWRIATAIPTPKTKSTNTCSDWSGVVAESVEHGSHIREIMASNPWSSQTNNLSN